MGLFAIATSLPAVADEVAGQVQIVVGAAQLIDASGKARALERGGEVRQGDRVVTEEGALVQLKLTDGTFVAVRTNTDVAIEKYRYDDKTAQNSSLLLRLARGALRSITGLIGGSNPGAYKIATPTATIGIRGTDHEPVYIPDPKPGETPIGIPGTYDKVNSGATVILTQFGTVDVKPGQVGFVPITPGVAPKLLPAVPDFFKRLDPKGDSAGRGGKELGSNKFLARPGLKPAREGEFKAVMPVDTIKSEATLSQTLNEPSSTLLAAPKLEAAAGTAVAPATTTAIAPTTTLAPTTLTAPTATMIAPTTTLVAPTTTLMAPTATMIAPTTTFVAPATTTIAPTTTINPTLTPKTISPILLK
ncbi:MAG: FecR domain-containing protein [Betaproteobacteria bacterium]|nr:FecR domain-containing protein [Betaproteobacteria bacterium]